MNPFSQLNPLRVRPAAILLALALILGGLVSLTSSTATATSPAGLFLGKYGQDSVLTTNSALPACDADPAVQVSATIDPVAAVTLSNGEYYGFVESLTSTTEFVLRHYDSAGTEINTVSSSGTIRGLHATGFIYEYTDSGTQQKLFFSNTGPIELGQITFVPGTALNECISSEFISNSTKASTYSYFKPTVSSVSPVKGSKEGGTTATINGSGFVTSYTSVRIGDVPATITAMTRTSITITTGVQPASAGAYRVYVKVGPMESTETVNFTYETPLCPGVKKARSAFVDNNLFLGGNHIELGISPLGNFGTSAATKPTGFIGTSGSRIGMSVDYDGFDCGLNNTSIDFFLPGTPEERFAVGAKIDGSNTPLYMGVSDLNSIVTSGIGGNRDAMISRTTITNLSTGTTLRATVVSKFVTTSNDNLMTVTQDISFTEDAMYFSNVVTIKNDNTNALSSARYMRSFDPDNTASRGGGYATENEVIAQYATQSYSAVRAQTFSDSDPTYLLFGTRAPILFYSSDPMAKAGSFGFANSNPYESGAYDSPANTGVFVRQDAGITMTMEFGSLTPGQEKSKMYITSLDLRDFSALETELEELVATVEARVAVETGSASTETVTRPSSGSGGFASLTPLPTVTPTPTPTPTRRPPAPSSPRPTVPLPVATSAPVALPAPLGPVVLIPELEVRPNVAFTPSNPVPAAIREVLSKPFGYQLDAAGEPELPALAPTQSLAFENGSPVGVELVPTEEQSGYILSGDGWQVELEATDSSGSPLKLDESGNIILNDDRFVEFSGTGFAPGSLVKVWLFSDPAELSQLTADSSGSFTGRALVPSATPVGEHTIQLNGISKDGQLRSVALGVVVQADAVLETSQFGWSWWYLLGGLLPFFWWIIWKRRKREEEEDQVRARD
jgi:hypothetical protein